MLKTSPRLAKRVVKFYDWLESPRGAAVSIGGAFVLFIVLTILVGCATFQPTTFNEKLAAGYSSVTVLAETTTTLLANKKLSINDAINVKSQLENAKTALDIAKSLRGTDPKLADDKLAASIVIIQALQKYLAAHPS